jgi:hypothetical protein
VQIFTADKFNFTDNAGFKLKIFSPNVGTNVLFKLEDTNDGGINNQVSQLTTIANGWEELTFDFPESDTNKFDRIIIFFGFEQGDALTVHFDELKIYPRSGGGGGTGDNLATNGDFETGDDTGWLLFQNGGTAVLDNTTNNGGSWSGKLETGGASNPAFKQERIGAGTVAAGDVVQIQFDHIGGIGGEGGVFNVLLFGEGAGGAVPFTHVFNPPPTPTGSWTTFTGTFTIPGGTDVSEGISFLIEAVCGGAPGCSVTVNIDNVSVILNP